MKDKLLPFLLAVVAFVLCFALFIDLNNSARYAANMRELNTKMGDVAGRVTRAFTYTDLLDTMVRLDEDALSEERFLSLTEEILSGDPYITSFQLVSVDGDSYVCPRDAAVLPMEETAASSSGLVIRVSEDGETPVLCGQKTVMVDGAFWGVATVTLDLDGLLEACGLTNSTFDVSIAIYDLQDTLAYVWGDPGPRASYDTELTLPHQRWETVIRHRFTAWELVWNYGLCLLGSLTAGIAVFIVGRDHLRKARQARTDPLTKTLSRTEFQRRVQRILRRGRSSGALLIIDLDRFKYINDTYGHLAGDQVLIYTAKRMLSAVRESDLVSRVGGDEYMILLRDLQLPEQAFALIRRLREASELAFSLDGRQIQVGLSIGYAFFPSDGTDYTALYQLADQRMYEDKATRHAALAEEEPAQAEGP